LAAECMHYCKHIHEHMHSKSISVKANKHKIILLNECLSVYVCFFKYCIFD